MENAEVKNTEVEAVEEIVEMAKVNAKTAGKIAGGIALAGVIIYGTKKLVWDKFVAPKIEDRKAKKMDKKLKKTVGDVEFEVVE